VFVWDGAKNAGLTVTSHFEKLTWSRCKEVAGDGLWCGTCHNPHGSAVNIRERCQSCHAKKPCTLDAAVRRKNGDDCQSCHMPKSEVSDAEHAVYTDHSIPRRPRAPAPATTGTRQLVPFWRHFEPEVQDVALAYAVAALTEPSVRRQAFDVLRTAAAKEPANLAVAAQLAQFYDRLGQPRSALPLLERVVAGNPDNTAALINLGALYAQASRISDAVALWQKALERNPALTQASMNLAVAQVRLGNPEAASASLRAALQWDPDNESLVRMLTQLQ
jgi:cytochrome c-type biogenesis protein CcmH/NrfG